MNVIIIEDETSVAQNLCDLLHEINPAIQILVVLETIRDSIHWLTTNDAPDIAFLDIKIADGTSFEIFEKVNINFPIIFTTAYDEYALKAFKYNSIDYLLKPINKTDLAQAIEKYCKLYVSDQAIIANNSKLIEVIKSFKQQSQKIYKKTFLVNYKNQLIPIAVTDIAYFHLEHRIVYCVTHVGKSYTIQLTLEKIQDQLDSALFFRANRQSIVSRKAVDKVLMIENRKLQVVLKPIHTFDMIVSKLNAVAFKRWLSEI